MPAFHKKRVESYRAMRLKQAGDKVERAPIKGNVREMVDLPS
jgi:hypothetical protein